MIPSPFNEERLADASREQILSAVFSDLAMQLANTALIFLGKIPHPETEDAVVDLESAKLFIDQLEMLEFKTRGNLDSEESRVLQEGLSAAKAAFVEVLNAQVDDSAGEAPIVKPSN